MGRLPKLVNNSIHYAATVVEPNDECTYDINLVDFGRRDSVNTREEINTLVSTWTIHPPFIEYYAMMDLTPDLETKCAQVLKVWYNEETRNVMGRVRLEGRMSRFVRMCIEQEKTFNVAVRGLCTQIPTGKPGGSVTVFRYTRITGLRFLFPDVRVYS